MRTGNPTLNEKTFEGFDMSAQLERGQLMTLNGTALKTTVLLATVVASAAFSWNLFLNQSPATMPLMIGGAIVGLIFAIATSFKPTWAPVTAPLYALAQGLFLGGLSAIYNQASNGIVMQAVFLTFGTMFALLFAYQSGLIRATENFKLGITAATGGIFLVYMATFVLGFFGIKMPFIHDTGLVGIGISAFIVIVAALNLVLDFDFIEEGVNRGAPKYMEWYGAFGLLVTLIWLYVEILRLLSKLNSRD
ncbi:Bax inhibitor-1/YccA family protein [Planctomicrobium sp. SH527]|uniref:Bax inhibitor-1/YccA family protein n=1 Tax=Planctomicrobium sp. SH527 TaxID=3448123 RepID=UPI003F5C5FC0